MIKRLLSGVHALRRFYWWLARPVTRGARAIVVDPKGDVLLVRHTYLEGWYLPGGKVHSGESYKNALIRELKEELGLQDIDASRMLGEYKNEYDYKKDTIEVFIVEKFTHTSKKHFEIAEWGFFSPEALPEKTSSGSCRRIEEWRGRRTISSSW